jgi:Holliday junction resolvase RusA-like endonuclease
VPAKHPVHAYRQKIAAEATRAGLEPQSEPVEVIVEAVFVRPKSHMTKKGVKPTAPKLPRPDVDNIAKAILDSLQDVMGDDTNVRLLTVGKAYGNESRTTVSVKFEKP